MACLGVEPGAAGWKAQTNPLSYGGTPQKIRILFLPHFAAKISTETVPSSTAISLLSLQRVKRNS